MSDAAATRDEMRDKILAEPDVILDDPDVMRALVVANERMLGSNVVDLRGIAMERLEARLDRLEETHRSVVAAAYENLAGANQVQGAVLRLLEPIGLQAFVDDLTGPVAERLRVDCAVLVFETADVAEDVAEDGRADPALPAPSQRIRHEATGFIEGYVARGRSLPARPVTLRQLGDGDGALYGAAGDWIRSEACLRLDLGEGHRSALLALGAEDPHQFAPSKGTDLLAFFAAAAERALRRWIR